MSDMLTIGIVAVMLGISLSLAVWKISSCLKSILDSTNRSVERERRDYLQLVEKLLEKRDVLPQQIPDLATLHAQERMQRVGEDARTDVASLPKNSPPRVTPMEGPGDFVNTDALSSAEAEMF